MRRLLVRHWQRLASGSKLIYFEYPSIWIQQDVIGCSGMLEIFVTNTKMLCKSADHRGREKPTFRDPSESQF